MATNISCDCTIIHQDVIDAVAKEMPEEAQLFELADLFKVFSDSTRIKILWALDCHEMCVCDLAALLSMTKSAVSHQLKSLRQARLVRYRRAGKVVFYALNDQHVEDIFEKGMEHIGER